MGGDITVRDEILLPAPHSGKKVIQSSYNTLDKRTLRKSRVQWNLYERTSLHKDHCLIPSDNFHAMLPEYIRTDLC